MDDLADIYRRRARAVFNYARSLTRSTEEAEDLVSETFVKAVLHWNDIRTATVRGYLLTSPTFGPGLVRAWLARSRRGHLRPRRACSRKFGGSCGRARI